LSDRKWEREELQLAGTPSYRAPELWGDRVTMNKKTDIYAYGVLLWNLWEQDVRVFDVRDLAELKEKVLKGDRPKFTDKTPMHVRNLIRKCWAQDAQNRPLFGEVVASIEALAPEIMIVEPLGRSVWDSLEKDENWGVQWKPLRRGLISELKTPKSHRKAIFTNMQLLLERQDHTVACMDYNRFLALFGPLHITYVQRFNELCAEGLFHGTISQNEAERRLDGAGRGSYFLRFSSDYANLTLSYYPSKDGISHLRILRAGDGYAAVDMPDEHATLKALISARRKKLKLKNVCTAGSKFIDCKNGAQK